MGDLKLDANGHVTFVNNDLVFVEGSEEVAQLILERLRTFLGEWFLDVTIGVPYFEEVLVKNPTAAESVLKREIILTPGVLELLEFTFTVDKSTRKATLNFKVISTDGPIERMVELP